MGVLVHAAALGGCPEDPAPVTDVSADSAADAVADVFADATGTDDGGADVVADAGDTPHDVAAEGVTDAQPEVFICTSSLECEDELGPLTDCKRAQCQADGTCAVVDRPDLTPCDDGAACTSGDKCAAGACEGGFDQCQCAADGDCEHLDDGDKCNGVWTCGGGGSCSFDGATVVTCGSGDACSDSSCAVLTGECLTNSKPDGTACDDGDVCTTVDGCQAGGCVGAVAQDCGQPAQCQAAVCDAVAGCSFEDLDSGACDDGDACTANDACSGGQCVGEGIKCLASGPCLTATCDSVAGCSEAPSGDAETCDDGDPCTETETCQAGACLGSKTCGCAVDADCPAVAGDKCVEYACVSSFCVPKPPMECAQNPNPCVVSECLPTTGQCGLVQLSNGALCDGGACFVGGKCIAGACEASPLACDDGNDCTVDSCDDALGCQHVAQQGAACEDGDLCTFGDSCDASGACVAGPPNPCDDGDKCTSDVCTPGVGCQSSQGADCDDGDKCTADLCVPATGCQHNAKACFGDIDVCLIPVCLQATGECGMGPAPAGFGCEDGDACTEAEACAAGECVGDAVDCDDKDECTADSCDSAEGCQNQAIPDCP